MQYEERKTKPESTRKLLIHQVEEQSYLCDVTIKMGQWEKKFHHCVLVASPFFDHVLKDNFLEKQTGKIEMTVGTPVTIEMAVLFLYGKKPKLTKENIEIMIDLAEFLLIPNLKSACINWLKTVSITEENCMKFLQLSSIYDFEIPKCNEYLMSHLTEMLQHTESVSLSKDTVQYLFSDTKLSYVSMDDKVNFLIRWINGHSLIKEIDMRELFGLIDFQNVSKTVLEEMKTYHNINKAVDIEKCLSNIEINNSSHRHRVLIMKRDHDGTFWCLDLERKKWFRIKTDRIQEGRPYLYYGEISGARDVGTEIFFINNSHSDTTLAMLNLEEDVCKTYRIVKEDDDSNLLRISGFCISGNACVVYLNERVKTNKQTRPGSRSRDIQSQLRLLSLIGDPIHQILALNMMERESIIGNEYADISTLFTGLIKDEGEEIKFSPLLTFKNEISKVCINKMSTVAILHGSKKLLSFFDLNDHTMETMQLETKYDDKLVESDEGFIVYNKDRCICFTRVIGPSLSSKFTSKEISLKIKGHSQSKMIFCGNMWYHYYREKEHFILQTASHSELTTSASVENVSWSKLPLPLDESRCYFSMIDHNLFQISLPKNKLRCDIECPHCQLRPEGRYSSAVLHDYDIGDTYYDDSSDDDYYGSVHYYDDSDYYYYDSD